MPPSSAAPTTEIGQATNAGVNPLRPGRIAAWTSFVDDNEYVPELAWPMSVKVYHSMRSDAQLSALHRGTTMPIRRYKWLLDPNGARPEIVEKLADDYGLDIVGQEPRGRKRQRNRFNFKEHQRKAFLALFYGHMFFEQVGRIGDDGFWHLRKLAERMPQTIQEIAVAPDGGLVYIRQNLATSRALLGELPEIPVDNLVGYIWEMEGGNWAGRSMMRECYRNFLIKDRLMRIDVINHERAGGVPWIESPPGATPSEIEAHAAMASQFKVGENEGGALPHGSTLHVARAGASDVVASIRLQNEEMARHFLMMFMQLGQTQTGSRALGESFIDFFALGQEAVANWFCDIFNQHQIEDDVDWNYGEDVEEVPLLMYEKSKDNEELATADLVSLIDSGAIVVDEELEVWLRHKHNMPAKKEGVRNPEDPPEPPPAAPGQPALEPSAPPAQAGRRSGSATAAAVIPSLSLPSRPLRRQPYDHEVAAATDFAALDVAWESEVDSLVREWQSVRSAQIQELVEAIVAANGSVKKLSTLSATSAGADLILHRMQNIASSGMAQAMLEASRQGITPKVPSLDNLLESMQARAGAVETLMATSLSESAARRAILVSELAPAEAAAEVREHLTNLSDAFLHDHLGGALMAAQNSGRKLVMRENDADEIYASELLDANTCIHCVARDGTQYTSMVEAERDYPTGGYRDCLGGPRCRGTLVAVYNES